MHSITKRFVLMFALLAVSALAFGASPAFNTLGHQVGANTYDPVSYFPEGGGKPLQGLIGIHSEYQGVTYRFRTKQNKALFDKSPEKYLPQYNGWCAWAMGALDREVDTDPEKFLIRNGKLYLFYNDPELDTRAMMLKDEANLFQKAEANWAKRTR